MPDNRMPDSLEIWKSEGPRHWLVAAWQESLRRVLESMVGEQALQAVTFQAVVAEPSAWSGWASPQWNRLTLDAVPASVLAIGCPAATVEALARLIAGDAALPEVACRDTYLEVLNQTASATADAISSRMGKRVNFLPAEISDSPPPEAGVHIEFPIDGAAQVMALAPDAAWIEAVSAAPRPALPAPAVAQPDAESPAQSPPPRNFDLLLDVELPVSVTFGRTQLPLKDVLKLSSGSIVELNRLANEPVDLLINNRIIARGEVVVVDGNYGIRVTEILSPQDRMRSLL